MTLYEQLGGEPRLRAILRDFYDQVFDDLMIGFLFRGQDKARLIELEYQFTARALGGDVDYQGRGMRAAHAKHPIMKGHFQRRNRILEETLRAHAVPEPVFQAWLGHARALERAIIGEARREAACNHDLQAERVGQAGPRDGLTTH